MADAALTDKKYDVLDSIVEDIHNKCIRMDREEQQALVNRFQRVIEKFISKMKNVDTLFSLIFNRIGYTGSYFEGIRVGEATEFDLNLILKPKNLSIKTDKGRSEPGYISVVVEDRYDSLPKHYKNWCKQFGSRTVLDPNLVSNWLQGVVSRTVSKIKEEGGDTFEDCEIKQGHKSGPAWTLVITSFEFPLKTIDVDLVPVLEFSCAHWPVPHPICGSTTETWFAVPKPPRNGNSSDWRLSFPKQETVMIRGLEYLKYTLRLMKRVRDQFDFKAIASYYIKTLFLWEVEKRDKNLWVRNRRGRLFIYMLIRMKDALEVQNIPFLWDERCNLLENLSAESKGRICLQNFHGRLKRFLKEIDTLINDQKLEQLNKFIREKLRYSEANVEGLNNSFDSGVIDDCASESETVQDIDKVQKVNCPPTKILLVNRDQSSHARRLPSTSRSLISEGYNGDVTEEIKEEVWTDAKKEVSKDAEEEISKDAKEEVSDDVEEEASYNVSLQPTQVDKAEFDICEDKRHVEKKLLDNNSSRHSTRRKRPVLKKSMAALLAKMKIKVLKLIGEQAQEEHEANMRLLKLKEEQDLEKLKQEKVRTEILQEQLNQLKFTGEVAQKLHEAEMRSLKEEQEFEKLEQEKMKTKILQEEFLQLKLPVKYAENQHEMYMRSLREKQEFEKLTQEKIRTEILQEQLNKFRSK